MGVWPEFGVETNWSVAKESSVFEVGTSSLANAVVDFEVEICWSSVTSAEKSEKEEGRLSLADRRLGAARKMAKELHQL